MKRPLAHPNRTNHGPLSECFGFSYRLGQTSWVANKKNGTAFSESTQEVRGTFGNGELLVLFLLLLVLLLLPTICFTIGYFMESYPFAFFFQGILSSFFFASRGLGRHEARGMPGVSPAM